MFRPVVLKCQQLESVKKIHVLYSLNTLDTTILIEIIHNEQFCPYLDESWSVLVYIAKFCP